MVLETDKEAHDIQARLLWPEIWKDMSSSSVKTTRETQVGFRENEARQCKKIARYCFIDPADEDFIESLMKCAEKFGSSDALGDTVEDDSGSYAVFTEQGSPASQMTTAKVMDVVARLPGCAGQSARTAMDKQQTQYQLIPK